MKESVREIRAAYRNFPVRFNYADLRVQAGYLIAYVPHYTDLLYVALNHTNSEIANESISNLIFFGSGPCPEIIGYLRYLRQHNALRDQSINLTIYDIAVNEWKWSRDIMFANVAPTYLNGNICTRRIGAVDFSSQFSIDFSSEKQLIVFQNCLNEISEDTHSVLISNVRRIFHKLSSGSYMAFIDLDYWQVKDLIASIENSFVSEFDVEIKRSISEGEIQHRTTQRNEPQTILDNLLTDRFGDIPTGLLPRRNIKFIFSLIKKK